MRAQPFHIHVEQRVLDDLQMRLERTRWAGITEKVGWDFDLFPKDLTNSPREWLTSDLQRERLDLRGVAGLGQGSELTVRLPGGT